MTKEQYLLTCLSEECAEVAQRCTKAIRFGIEEVQDGQELTNLQRLQGEINDFLGVLWALHKEGIDISLTEDEAVLAKRHKVERYYNYSKSIGSVE